VIRAVIFDLGHTVWDYAPREEVRRLTVLRVHERLRQTLGDDLLAPPDLDRSLGQAVARWFQSWNDRERLEQPPSDTLVREVLRELGIESPDGVVDDVTEIIFGLELDMPVVEPDTLAALATLHQRGLALGCVTNTILLEGGIVDLLQRLGLRRYFESAVASSAMGYRKPHASLFQRALDELRVAPGEALFVGDRLVDDVSGAQGAGMRGVLTHQYRQEPLDGSTVRPDTVVRRLSEVPALVERLAAG